MSTRGPAWRVVQPNARGVFAAGLAVCLSLGVLAWSAWRAFDLEPLPGAAPAAPPRAPLPVGREEAGPLVAVLAAVDLDPFAPDRRRPATRFRLPEERLAAVQQGYEAAAAAAAEASFQLTLIGTAVLPEGRSFAVAQWNLDPPRLVRVGETIGTLTLRQVQQGRAVFVSATGARTEVLLPKPGS